MLPLTDEVIADCCKAQKLEDEIYQLFRKHFPEPSSLSSGIATAALLGVCARIYVASGAPVELGLDLFRDLHRIETIAPRGVLQ